MTYGLVIMVLVAFFNEQTHVSKKKNQTIEFVPVGVLWPDDRNQKQINK